MSYRVDPIQLKAEARVVAAPNQRSCQDHSFELPTGLYIAMAALFFGFLGILAIGLSTPGARVDLSVVGEVAFAWLVTAPSAGLLAALAWLLLGSS